MLFRSLSLLEQLQRKLGLAYLFITHNIGVVEYIAVTSLGRGGLRTTARAAAVALV